MGSGIGGSGGSGGAGSRFAGSGHTGGTGGSGELRTNQVITVVPGQLYVLTVGSAGSAGRGGSGAYGELVGNGSDGRPGQPGHLRFSYETNSQPGAAGAMWYQIANSIREFDAGTITHEPIATGTIGAFSTQFPAHGRGIGFWHIQYKTLPDAVTAPPGFPGQGFYIEYTDGRTIPIPGSGEQTYFFSSMRPRFVVEETALTNGGLVGQELYFKFWATK